MQVCDAGTLPGHPGYPLQETSHPWDHLKTHGQQGRNIAARRHSFVQLVHGNLPPHFPDEVAVCNLASVNLACLIWPQGLDSEELSRTVAVACGPPGQRHRRQFLPHRKRKARHANPPELPRRARRQGLAEVFARLGMVYGDPAGAGAHRPARWNTSATMPSRPAAAWLRRGDPSSPSPEPLGPGIGAYPIDTWVALQRDGEPPTTAIPPLHWDLAATT